jgi:hypothetical protein
MSGGTDTLKGANVSKCIPRPLVANSCEVRFSECGNFPQVGRAPCDNLLSQCLVG